MSEVMRIVFDNLKFTVLHTLLYPCEHCNCFDCKKWDLKSFLKKRYAKEDFIDYKDCLRRKRQRLKELLVILRNPIFRQYANEPCEKCNRKMFWRDMVVHIEIEKAPTQHKGSHEMKFFRLCPKCDRNYTSGKTPLFAGFEKR